MVSASNFPQAANNQQANNQQAAAQALCGLLFVSASAAAAAVKQLDQPQCLELMRIHDEASKAAWAIVEPKEKGAEDPSGKGAKGKTVKPTKAER